MTAVPAREGLVHAAVRRPLEHASGMAHVFGAALYHSTVAPLRGAGALRDQLPPLLCNVGARSLPIVALVNFLVGAIMVLQTGDVMQRYGQIHEAPGLVALAVVRELGPLMTAVVMTARIGASFTAVLASMKLNEEVLALETMAIPPSGYLVAPRFLALLVMLPCLTVIAYLMGILGGAVVADAVYDLPLSYYAENTFQYLGLADLWSGLLKATVFAVLISVVSCYFGLIAEGGPTGLGRYTMVAVVTGLVVVVVADAVLTAFSVNYLLS